MFHRHRWVTVSCQRSERWNMYARSYYTPTTSILQRCRCGKSRTDMIDGVWTEADLGIDQQVVADLMKLLNEV